MTHPTKRRHSKMFQNGNQSEAAMFTLALAVVLMLVLHRGAPIDVTALHLRVPANPVAWINCAWWSGEITLGVCRDRVCIPLQLTRVTLWSSLGGIPVQVVLLLCWAAVAHWIPYGCAFTSTATGDFWTSWLLVAASVRRYNLGSLVQELH
jgi:hypothetical protein